MTWLEQCDRLPPFAARLVARDRNRALLSGEIAARAIPQMSVGRVVWISKQDSWASIPVGEMDAFLRACGIEPSRLRRPLEFLRRSSFRHINSLPKRQQQFLARICR